MAQEISRRDMEQLVADCTPNIQTATRQVPGGYIITGRIDWMKGGDPIVSQTDECVVPAVEDHADLIAIRISNYHAGRNFNNRPERG